MKKGAQCLCLFEQVTLELSPHTPVPLIPNRASFIVALTLKVWGFPESVSPTEKKIASQFLMLACIWTD